MTDVMKQLRAADPARRAGLESVPAATFAALREEIAMTGTQLDTAAAERVAAVVPGARRRALGRRGVVAVSLAGVLVGGGAAYAGVQYFAATSTEGVHCMTTWDDSALEGLKLDAGGPWLTGDAIADCTAYLAQEGLGPVEDPVVFEHDGHVFVTPADQAPEWAELIDSQAGPEADPRMLELRLSAADRIDGGRSTCRTVAEGVAWAEAEVARLGLDLPVERGRGNTDEEPCSWVTAEGEGAVVVAASKAPDALLYTPEIDPVVGAVRRGLSEQCLTAEQAADLVTEAYGTMEHWPTTTVVDEDLECATADLAVGGSIQVTVYGPTTAG